MREQVLGLLATCFLLVFAASCAASGLLQAAAYARHGREGATLSPRAFLDPGSYLDDIGVRQIRLSRTLLKLGIGSYVGFLGLTFFANALR